MDHHDLRAGELTPSAHGLDDEAPRVEHELEVEIGHTHARVALARPELPGAAELGLEAGVTA